MFRAVYDGKIWREFQNVDGRPFLSQPGALALMMNVDWFQVYSNSPYSVGVIYFSVLNLPRTERFKKENIIVSGIMPGPKEPGVEEINHYLEPLVDDLENLWNGGFTHPINGKHIDIMAAVLMLSMDIPAGRKIAGFLSYCAKLGCSKCLKEFKTG